MVDESPSREVAGCWHADGKNHAALILLTGSGVTADNTISRGKPVAALVLPKLK